MAAGGGSGPVTACKVFRYEDPRRSPPESACVSIPEVSLTSAYKQPGSVGVA